MSVKEIAVAFSFVCIGIVANATPVVSKGVAWGPHAARRDGRMSAGGGIDRKKSV